MQTIELETPVYEDGHLTHCIEQCLECHDATTRGIFQCIERGGAHAEPAHIRMLMDCAHIAQTSADFMLRGSEHHHFTCGVCSKICERCADECDALSEDDDYMAYCAETCRRCAESCHEMTIRHAVAKGEGNQH